MVEEPEKREKTKVKNWMMAWNTILPRVVC